MDILTENDVAGSYPLSYYAANCTPPAPHSSLKGAVKADVCIVGGGFTGLSSALHLAHMGLDVVVLEANRVGWGASGRNGGQMGSGQRIDQDALERLVGEQNAHKLWNVAQDAKQLVKDLIADCGINCDFVPGIIEADHKPRFVSDHHRYVEKLNAEYGYNQIEPLTKSNIRNLVNSDAYFGGSIDKGAGHLNPLAFCFGLAEAAQKAGTRIFERSRVTKVEQGQKVHIHTDTGHVEADFLVLGCNGYLGTLNKDIADHVMPINSFIVATEPLGEARAAELITNNAAVADSRFVVNYFRLSPDHRLLFGGGETYGIKFPNDLERISKRPMLSIFPQLADVKIDYAWGGTLGITMNRLPHFKRVDSNIFSAAGFSGHGLAMATLAGKIMGEIVGGTSDRFDLMSSLPQPRFPGGTLLRTPLLSLAMTYYALRDRI